MCNLPKAIWFTSVHLNKSLLISSFPPQRSVPFPESPRRRLVDALSWSWRRWRPVWTSSPQETSCPASAQTLAFPSRCRWRPPSLPGRPWSLTWCPAGAPSPSLLQPFTWPPRPLQRRRPRKVSDNAAVILLTLICIFAGIIFIWKVTRYICTVHRRIFPTENKCEFSEMWK